jgi:hypothetical protein
MLKEYQDVLVGYYKDLEGLMQEMVKMKIYLLLNENFVKKRPYKLAHKYKDIVKK